MDDLHMWFPQWSMEEEVWWCFAGNTVSDSFRIQGTANQHGYHSILQRSESDGVLHQMTWPPQSLNPIEMVWDELDHRVKEKQPTSAQHMWELIQDCWKSIPGEAGWENAKSVQSCHQGKGWLLWRIWNIQKALARLSNLFCRCMVQLDKMKEKGNHTLLLILSSDEGCEADT